MGEILAAVLTTVLTTTAATIVTSLLTSSATTGILLAMAKLWMDRSLERHKAELQKEAFEHQVMFRNLHERRAEVIAETYAMLQELCDAANVLVTELEYWPDEPPTEKQRVDRFNRARQELVSY